jgi:endonuclease/exonuclease/phosphatase (EEP) superfamily protein YafD
VHPTPPVPNENPRSTERDKELLLVADLAKASDLPVIVIGDLNDVAWSYTTELFLKMSGLIDPRRGRGFYNSFHAHYPFLRFPLDHAFISTDFKLKGYQTVIQF